MTRGGGRCGTLLTVFFSGLALEHSPMPPAIASLALRVNILRIAIFNTREVIKDRHGRLSAIFFESKHKQSRIKTVGLSLSSSPLTAHH